MEWQSVELEVPATASEGAKKPTRDLDQKWAQVQWDAATCDGTFELQESGTGGADASEWAQVGADITGAAFIEVAHPCQYMRVVCTVEPGVGKVPPAVIVMGRNQRTV